MLKIRLARGGAKKRPYYSIVIADSHSPRDGRFIEKVGAYDPLIAKDKPGRVTLKVERIEEWLKKGAQPTDRVARFLSAEGLASWEHGDNPHKGKPGKKSEERAAERAQRDEDRKAAEAEARAQAVEPVAEEPVAAEPAPVEAAEPAPVEAVELAPVEAAEPAPVEAAAESAPEPAAELVTKAEAPVEAPADADPQG